MSGYYAVLLSSAGKAEIAAVASATPTYGYPISKISESTVTITVSSSTPITGPDDRFPYGEIK